MPSSSGRGQPRPTPSPSTRATWLARSAFALALASAAVLVGFAGSRSLVMLIVGVCAVIAVVVGAFWGLAHRGLLRIAGGALVLVGPVAVLILYLRAGLLWVAILSVLLLVLASAAGGAALVAADPDTTMPTYAAAPVKHPFLVMNPRSGGGKVSQFRLQEKAQALGAEVALLDGPGMVDVVALVQDAVTRGADLLGVAGGDGTQALVAAIAAEHDLPFVVISAGTRNHFALDLGLDRADPSRCLSALTDGIELRVDLGMIGDRAFVNNASFGAYAQIVRSPAYREDQVGTALQLLPDLMVDPPGSPLVVRVAEVSLENAQAVLVSNGPYGSNDLAGFGRRPRLDSGALGVVALSVTSARQAVGLLRPTHQNGLTRRTAPEVVIDADTSELPVAIDGEATMMPTPIQCRTLPRILRVRVPRDRPGTTRAQPQLDWPRLRRLARPGKAGVATKG